MILLMIIIFCVWVLLCIGLLFLFGLMLIPIGLGVLVIGLLLSVIYRAIMKLHITKKLFNKRTKTDTKSNAEVSENTIDK